MGGQVAGGLVVTWSPLNATCVPGAAAAADGSVPSCAVGEPVPTPRPLRLDALSLAPLSSPSHQNKGGLATWLIFDRLVKYLTTWSTCDHLVNI